MCSDPRYSAGVGSLATFAPDKEISLPAQVGVGVAVADLVEPSISPIIEGFRNEMLCGEAELRENEVNGLPNVYYDPVLKKNKCFYKKFIRDLYKRGMLRFTKEPKEECGMFFVTKKSGALRFICDARRANARFKLPPGVALATGDSLSRLEVDEGDEIFIAHLDVKDYFHQLRMPLEMSQYFCFLPILATDVFGGVPLVEGGHAQAGELIYPCLASLPMGFSWSLFFAQKVLENQLCLAGLSPDKLLVVAARRGLGDWRFAF